VGELNAGGHGDVGEANRLIGREQYERRRCYQQQCY
jgi:hypothetical protein